MRATSAVKGGGLWRPKPLSIFSRIKEGLDHFRLHKVSAELIKLVQPKLKPLKSRLASGASSGLRRR
jgi:hypothetical protein